MTAYQDRVDAARLASQGVEVQKAAGAILDELANLRHYLYWALDPAEDAAYYCQSLLDHAHMLVDLAHDYRAALKAHPPLPETDDDDQCPDHDHSLG